MRRAILCGMIAAVPCATGAMAQQPSASPTHTPNFFRSYEPRYVGVEQMVEDMSLLATSLRSLQSGLQRPSGFEGVFRVPEDTNNPGSLARLMRIDGAVAATFPQSVYMGVYLRERRGIVERTTKIGDLPLVPPGTVFRIGLPEVSEATPPRPRPETAIDPQLAAQRVEAQPFAEATNGNRRVPRMFNVNNQLHASETIANEGETAEEADQRAERMRELLSRAARAEQGAKGSSR